MTGNDKVEIRCYKTKMLIGWVEQVKGESGDLIPYYSVPNKNRKIKENDIYPSGCNRWFSCNEEGFLKAYRDQEDEQ